MRFQVILRFIVIWIFCFESSLPFEVCCSFEKIVAHPDRFVATGLYHLKNHFKFSNESQ